MHIPRRSSETTAPALSSWCVQRVETRGAKRVLQHDTLSTSETNDCMRIQLQPFPSIATCIVIIVGQPQIAHN